jgi:hypothetical protein
MQCNLARWAYVSRGTWLGKSLGAPAMCDVLQFTTPTLRHLTAKDAQKTRKKSLQITEHQRQPRYVALKEKKYSQPKKSKVWPKGK